VLHWPLAGPALSRYWHAIPAHIPSQGRNLPLRGFVTMMIAMELATLLWRRRADNDHKNVGCGIKLTRSAITALAVQLSEGKYQ
jgi:hypothetical protein